MRCVCEVCVCVWCVRSGQVCKVCGGVRCVGCEVCGV